MENGHSNISYSSYKDYENLSVNDFAESKQKIWDMVKEKFPEAQIYILDTLSATQGHNLVLKKAKELRDNNNYGLMLDMMDDSAIFAGAVNQMVRELVQETSLYPSIIKPTDLSDAKLDEVRNSDGGWSGELAILTSVNPTADFQGGAIIDTLRQSIILGDRLPDFVWEVVVEKGLSTYISQADFLAAYNEVEYKIALGELTSDPADDYSWAQEVDTLIAFANEVENVKANPLNGVTTLISLASQSVIAGFMINNVINSL